MAEDSAFRSATTIAQTFVEARRLARPLADFPGAPPTDLAGAYEVQDAAIGLWPDAIVGWKVGRVPPAFEARLGQSRLAGPIFRAGLWPAEPGAATRFPVIEGGFAAVEAELVYVIGRDVPAGKVDWTPGEALDVVESQRLGVEIAGSPLASINRLGSTVVASDFGNNTGLILGAAVSGTTADLVCETFIDGVSVGRGGPGDILGGPLGSLCFLLAHCARHGRPLQAGQMVSTGAMTGIHDIVAGQTARVRFGELGEIACAAVPAEPLS
jgi:2-keto-4-pentenoate hydratase